MLSGMAAVYLFLATLAAGGLVLSVIAHVAGVLGLPGPLGARTMIILFPGMFVVWAPAVLATRHSPRYRQGADLMNLLARRPRWLRILCYATAAYIVVNFFAAGFIWRDALVAATSEEATAMRIWTGHAIVFYGAGFLMLNDASQEREKAAQPKRRCVGGHVLGDGESVCPTCGLAVDKGAGG